ncbi:hypothetical protein COX11_01380 [Candidatus Berkelbacteria bacterium CG23_combo_of_CG06-09_8_20_14_all_41_73]|uniref:Homing endonuclease LAGLIDADG domain-containing protein n=2 Tax=Candidatus Berkelbacteria TaxID=1618330 RepID=A0A2H0AZU0_9BACT|nr:MAG: hypothetical protein COX11_01380 [Candidatus Berkelbacteria bacterium CG23_combo_of_CG06-09_8_20_14_all_41_73]PIR27201.1 MAG: hypothetical protein COV40_02145 [Candidatus Berkelbacteria bacterium CG11_big_fil_rev_8_21_14_0_20_42_15]
MSEFKWSNNLAYAVGLLATDGCLSKDGRHIDLTSKDIEQLENFNRCLNKKYTICFKSSGFSNKKYPRIQFGDVKFYRWLENIGLHPNKSKTIGSLEIPDEYFFDFLRGSHDGDGCFYSYWDPRWKSSFMFYLQFTSGSKKHLIWLNNKIFDLINVQGKIRKSTRSHQLIFAKKSSKLIIKKMFCSDDCVYLSRKKKKIFKALNAEVAKLAHALP